MSQSQTLTVQLRIAAPMEEALRLAAWEDERSIGDLVREAIARDLRRRMSLRRALPRPERAETVT